VWVASPSTREFLLVRAGGEVADRVSVDGRMAIACMLGGADRRTLFLLTVRGSGRELATDQGTGCIESVQVEVSGAGFP